jgi:hypothetical protein
MDRMTSCSFRENYYGLYHMEINLLISVRILLPVKPNSTPRQSIRPYSIAVSQYIFNHLGESPVPMDKSRMDALHFLKRAHTCVVDLSLGAGAFNHAYHGTV